MSKYKILSISFALAIAGAAAFSYWFITQIQAIRAALKALESTVLEKHLQTCVKDAWTSDNQKEADKKLSELMELFRRN